MKRRHLKRLKPDLTKFRLPDGTVIDRRRMEPGTFIGRWNGELCLCRVLEVKILDVESSAFALPWWKPFVGETFQAVEVRYYGKRFYISNADGSGMSKVTVGMGSPEHGHAGFETVELVRIVTDPKEWNLEFDLEESVRISERSDDFWRVHDPEAFERMLELRENLKKIQEGLKQPEGGGVQNDVQESDE